MSTDYLLTSNDALTQIVKNNGVKSWNELTGFIKHLPYGRNANRTNFGLVLYEKKGSCSSKHALLKSIADLNNIPDVQLILGIYRMTESNTPRIGTILTDNSIEYIPEAHCYLMIDGNRKDFTAYNAEFEKIEKDIIGEKEIEPQQVAEFKIDYHKKFIENWLKETNSTFEFDRIWQIREQCIENLTK